jgi:PHD/YefM family antitoxin component YafN of YafNO toxin-antitoxin module
MSNDTAPQPRLTSNHNSMIRKAKRFVDKLGWLTPTSSLMCMGGKDFGRGITASLTEINQGGSILRLQLHKRDAAVVMGVDHYEEMVQMKALYVDLIERLKETEISEEAGQYETLYSRIVSPKSRQAADALFSATSENLRKSYQPGKTENP